MSFGTNDHIWKRGYGGGWVGLFGVPFLLGGLYFLIDALGSLGVKDEDGNATWSFFDLLFGMIFTAAGVALVFGRAGLEINRLTRTVKTWWGLLLFPLRRKEYPLSEYDRVTLATELRTKKGRKVTVYTVRLTGETRDVPLEAWHDYEYACKQSEELSRFCGLPVSDLSRGEDGLHDPDRLDDSLHAPDLRQREDVELPLRPATMKTKLQFRDDEIILDFPPPPGGLVAIIVYRLLLLIPLGLVLYLFFLPMLRAKNGFPGPVGLLIALAMLVIVVRPLYSSIRGASNSIPYRNRVIASPDQLTLEQGAGQSTSTNTIPAGRITEMELPPLDLPPEDELAQAPRLIRKWFRQLAKAERGIVARSDSMTLTFGKGLPEDELKYLHAVLLKMLSL